MKTLQKINLFMALLMLIPFMTFAQPKIIAVGSKAAGSWEYTDSILTHTLRVYCDVTYTDQASFNNHLVNGAALVYDDYDGVIFFESCGSSASQNFATDEFPIPCVTMEAGFLLKWELLDPDLGGIWPFYTPEDIDMQWRIVEADHPITYWASDGTYKNDDIITWCDNPDPAIYGIPYIYGVAEDVEILITAARDDGKLADGTYDDASNEFFDQDEAITLCILPNQKILYLCAPVWQIATQNAPFEVYATENFFNLLKNSVLYMFDELPPVVGIADIHENHQFNVYPNPANDMVTVKLANNLGSVVTLTNFLGQKVAEYNMTGEKLDIITSSLSAGVYFVQINNETLKLIIE